jgi:nicotinamidase/pyrazinamidase
MRNTMAKHALGIVDVQCGFMAAAEGERVGVAGFGELPIQTGAQVVAPCSRLLAAAAARGWVTFTTQDWHPAQTAHFGTPPNFSTSWPVHCVADTPGAQLHPELVVPAGTWVIHKGMEVLTNGADDTSYSACNGFDAAGVGLAAALRNAGVTHVYLAGLAFDYCVGYTALDLRKAGFAVTVLEDATESIADASRVQMRARLLEVGVVLAASATVA